MASARIAIVTDSTADLPVQETSAPGIKVIPALITIDEESFEDSPAFDRAQFYRGLPGYRTAPTTASPSPAVFAETYTSLLQAGYEKIISVHVSKKLSAIYNMAVQAAKEFGSRVHVFDSEQLSLGIGFQAMEAAAAARMGADVEQILALLARCRERTRVIAMINRLDYLRRSGRVNWVTASIGAWLHVKMVVGLSEGAVQRLTAVRTRRKALLEMQDIVRGWGPLSRLGVLHTGIPGEAAEFARSLETFTRLPPLIQEATTVIGTHIGEGSMGIAALTC